MLPPILEDDHRHQDAFSETGRTQTYTPDSTYGTSRVSSRPPSVDRMSLSTQSSRLPAYAAASDYHHRTTSSTSHAQHPRTGMDAVEHLPLFGQPYRDSIRAESQPRYTSPSVERLPVYGQPSRDPIRSDAQPHRSSPAVERQTVYRQTSRDSVRAESQPRYPSTSVEHLPGYRQPSRGSIRAELQPRYPNPLPAGVPSHADPVNPFDGSSRVSHDPIRTNIGPHRRTSEHDATIVHEQGHEENSSGPERSAMLTTASNTDAPAHVSPTPPASTPPAPAPAPVSPPPLASTLATLDPLDLALDAPTQPPPDYGEYAPYVTQILNNWPPGLPEVKFPVLGNKKQPNTQLSPAETWVFLELYKVFGRLPIVAVLRRTAPQSGLCPLHNYQSAIVIGRFSERFLPRGSGERISGPMGEDLPVTMGVTTALFNRSESHVKNCAKAFLALSDPLKVDQAPQSAKVKEMLRRAHTGEEPLGAEAKIAKGTAKGLNIIFKAMGMELLPGP